MQALRTFVVRPKLPEPLDALDERLAGTLNDRDSGHQLEHGDQDPGVLRNQPAGVLPEEREQPEHEPDAHDDLPAAQAALLRLLDPIQLRMLGRGEFGPGRFVRVHGSLPAWTAVRQRSSIPV